MVQKKKAAQKPSGLLRPLRTRAGGKDGYICKTQLSRKGKTESVSGSRGPRQARSCFYQHRCKLRERRQQGKGDGQKTTPTDPGASRLRRFTSPIFRLK